MRADPEQRAVQLAEYIVERGATVRAAAAAFGCSKSTVHKDVSVRLVRVSPGLSFVVSATGNVEAGDTEVGGKKVYLFIQCQDGKKMVHALFVGERGILEGLCLLCACLQAKQQRENEE